MAAHTAVFHPDVIFTRPPHMGRTGSPAAADALSEIVQLHFSGCCCLFSKRCDVSDWPPIYTTAVPASRPDSRRFDGYEAVGSTACIYSTLS